MLVRALERLGQRAEAEGLRLEICLFGGALMMLAYDARAATKDVDAIIHPREEGLRLAEEVGREDAYYPDDVIRPEHKAVLNLLLKAEKNR